MNLKQLIRAAKIDEYKKRISRIALMTGMIALFLSALIGVISGLSQPKKIAYQADQEDQCVMFLQTSNETFYELKSYERGVCEYTRGEIK